MPRKKQQCLFGIPWISTPSTESHSLNPKQKSKSATTNATLHRPPFRPPGIASTPPQPPHGTSRTEPPKASNSLPPQSPTSSVIIDSPVSSPSQSPSTPSKKNTNPPPHSEPKMKSPTKELKLDSANENPDTPLEKQSKSHHSKSKANNRNKEPIPRPKVELHTTTTTTASTSGVKTKDALYKNQKEAKIMFATSTPSGKDIKVVTPASTSANPVSRNESTIPLSSEEIPTMQNDIQDVISTVSQKLPIDDKTVSVVTLAGDNRGVTMNVAAGSHSNSTKTNREQKNTSMEKKDEAGKTYVNSNIQSINNSIMSYGSITGRDPGVRVILPQHHEDNKQTCFEGGKAEVSINREERLPYRPQPVVRRRCLRGLFLEPSDSDPDNPDKPRRHGCKFSCGEITKDKDAVTK